MPMLQDLDSLIARIEQMVKLTHQLQTERASLLARVKSLEDERHKLGAQLQQREAEFSTMTTTLADHESSMQAAQAQAVAVQAQLQLELDQCKQQHSVTEQQLQESLQATKRLSMVSDQARRQIDSILVRLPGPSQE